MGNGHRGSLALGPGPLYARRMRGLDQIPWAYDAFMTVADVTGLSRWRRWLVRGARGRTLEVGCGTGRNLPLYPPAVRALGVDPCWETLAAARRRAPGALFVRASAEALPFRACAFDTVVASLVFCSVPDPMRGLAEVKRVLAPGGVLRMMEHVRSRSALGGRVQDLVQPAWTRLAGGCHPNRETERSVEAAGFRIEDAGRRAARSLRRFEAVPAAAPSALPLASRAAADAVTGRGGSGPPDPLEPD
jgi:ubiquinone/menaquinone biosynthesis C-methylase UbiE